MSNLVLPILLRAEDESRRARSYFVGTEHLFLAIVGEGGDEVADILSREGVQLKQAEARVRELLRHWEPDENWSGLMPRANVMCRVSRTSVRSSLL